jgi:alcohol dehydrogenase class IV
MSQRIVCCQGAVRDLAEIVADLGGQRVLLVTGRGSYALSGAETAISEALGSCELARFSDFDENPKLEHVIRGIEVFRRVRPDIVIGVGGGTAMDMAKMIDLLVAQEQAALEYVEGRLTPEAKAVPLIALPTTAGSGSQATHFAAVYVGRIKFSIAHASMLPDVAIVDPDLLVNLPKKVAASAGLDALNQGIESFWSIHATEASRAKAREAIAGVWGHLARMVSGADDSTRLAMAQAAHLAGEAIDITKTTAPHAISYPITAHFGASHGQAVGLVLPSILLYNAEVDNTDCLHPGGPSAVRESLRELATLLGASDSMDAVRRYAALMDEIGLSRDLASFGIKTPEDIEIIVCNGFDPQRVNNNPRRLTAEALRNILRELVADGVAGR